MKILVTAFQPFGGESTNPAQDAVKLIGDEIAGAEIIKVDVPVVFGEAIEVVHEKMKEVNPDVVWCIGQAGGRIGLTPERVAINVDDGRIKDNAGYQPIDATIFEDGENAYFSNLPVKAIVQTIREAGLPSSLSNSAGTYVCNHLMYGVLYHIDKEFPNARGGFMHVPFSHSQVLDKANTPSLSVEDIAKGIEASIEAIVKYDQDIEAVEGTTH